MTVAASAAKGGDRKIAAFFKSIWVVDFEYHAEPGERPWVVCMVAKNLVTHQQIKMWRDELFALRQAPFDVAADDLFVSFYAPAELGCFLALGWECPENILDLYVEHRVEINGSRMLSRNSLIDALAFRGLQHIGAVEKEAMRDLVIKQWSWTTDEQKKILNHCSSDVDAAALLYRSMESGIDWPRALLRGRYTRAVAAMESNGVPVDVETYRDLVRYWRPILGHLIANIDRDFGVYEGLTFKMARFEALLAKRSIPWPKLESGKPKLDKDTFRAQAKKWPEFEPLRQLRQSLGEMKLNDLQVGSDGRNRTMLSPFGAITGRNQPSNSKFIFGPSRWLRGLIKPAAGYGLAYIDWSSQEIALAAALSGDELLIEAYRDGDPYLAFAKQAKLVPETATAQSHKAMRDRCKEVVLGVNYGMGPATMAERAGISVEEAQDLLKAHRNTYRTFWSWSDGNVSQAFLANEMQTMFGWRRKLKAADRETSVMNFPMQAHGAEMMRLAAIAATEAGITVCAPVHDAFLIEAPLAELDDRVAQMRQFMADAGSAVTGGFPVRTSSTIIRFPDRFSDDLGYRMWDDVIRLIGQFKKAAA